jgi:hypothetical protein
MAHLLTFSKASTPIPKAAGTWLNVDLIHLEILTPLVQLFKDILPHTSHTVSSPHKQGNRSVCTGSSMSQDPHCSYMLYSVYLFKGTLPHTSQTVIWVLGRQG